MPTGQSIINTAMQNVGVLAAGATATTSETAQYLSMLNAILEEFQQGSFLGNTETISTSGRQITRSVNNAGVWTVTDVGGTTTRVVTPTPVTLFASANTNNTYPVGWQQALEWTLAARIGGSQGVPNDIIARCVAQSEALIAQIRPKDVSTPPASTQAQG